MTIESILKNFYELTQTPTRLFQKHKLAISYGANVFSEAYDDDIIRQFLNSSDSLCYQNTPETLIYGFLQLNSSDEYLVFGPVRREEDINALAIRLSGAYQCQITKELWDHCRSLRLYSLHSFLAILQTLYSSVHRENLCAEHILSTLFSSHLPQSEKDITQALETEQLLNYTLEERLLSCITHGKKDELLSIYKYEISGADEPEYTNISSLRTYKNVFISTATLSSRAAIHGGMNYNAAIEASNIFISRVEQMNSVAEIELELAKMMSWYTDKVAELSAFSDATPLIRSTVAYIQSNLGEKLTVNDIAKSLGQNPSYLSHHFKEQTKENLNTYITKEKINKAKRLLRGSNFDLLEISTQLGFSSQQYFQNVFKKNVGMTPTEYRGRKYT